MHNTIYSIFAGVTKLKFNRYIKKKEFMQTLTNMSQKPASDETSHAAVIHVSGLLFLLGMPLGSVLGTLLTWLLWRNESSFVDTNGKEAVNFNLSIILYQFLIVITGLVLFLSPVLSMFATDESDPFTIILSIPGLLLLVSGLILLSLFRIILVLMATLKAGNGDIFRYPLTIHFIK